MVKDAYYELMDRSRITKDWVFWIQRFKHYTRPLEDSEEPDYIKLLESILSNIDPNNINCIDAFMAAQLNDCAVRLGLI